MVFCMGTCEDCGERKDNLRDGVCFRCRVSTVGFTYVGGGGYGREQFHNMTNAEMAREQMGDGVLGVDVQPKGG